MWVALSRPVGQVEVTKAQCMESLRLESKRVADEAADAIRRVQAEWEHKHVTGIEELQRLTTEAVERQEQQHRQGRQLAMHTCGCACACACAC